MYIDNLINKFGYSEMYEWSELFKYDIVPYGRFVEFTQSYVDAGKIQLCNGLNVPIGVTTINAAYTSDDPDEWQGKYLCNEYGDILLEEKESVEAVNRYDNAEDMPYIATLKTTKVVPVINDEFDNELTYKKRTDRNEWIRVHLLGKCIVVDNGECVPGEYCTAGKGGIAVPWKHSAGDTRYPVLGRLTENTIMIFFK